MSLIHILLGPADFNEQIPDRDDCIYWRDDLSIGPVPATEKLEDLSRIRESFWKTSTPLARLSDEGRKRAIEKGGAGQLPERIELAQRDEQIRRLADSSELVIWCASNRREILMLLALVNSLDAVSARNMRITVAPCATWGPLAHRAERLVHFFSARWLITPEFAALACDAWRQYTAPDPTGLNDIVTRLLGQDDPSLGNVLSRVLEEYPAVGNGLSRIEEKMLQSVGEGNSIVRIVGRTMGNSEECFGDWPLFERIWEFVSADVPVLELVDGVALAELESVPAFTKSMVRLTNCGKQLLSGACDYVNINGLDRWIGGVHLRGNTVPWRYDLNAGGLVSA
jgi:Domain of unknown function (DUF1835)